MMLRVSNRTLFRLLLSCWVTTAALIHTPSAVAQVTSAQWLETSRSQVHNLDTLALQQFVNKHPDAVLIDVRMADEIDQLGGTIDAGFRTYNINRGWLEFRVETRIPDKSTPIVVFCGINERSPLAAQTLTRLGYENVHNYADGFFAWRDAGLPIRRADKAPGSMLFSLPLQVTQNVWSAIGETGPPSRANSGHNNNLSFVVTDDGVVVVNAGDNYLLAQALHMEIRKHTALPVKYVILENGQGHAMLGMNYWQAQGAKVIAHVDAAHEIEAYGADIYERMMFRNRDKGMGTSLSQPDITFEDEYVIELGGTRIEALNLGPAHSPGDIVVWLPDERVAISGDMAFHERLLPVFEATDTAGWIESWARFKALGAETIIPGHGGPTQDFAVLERYTVGYLRYMRERIGVLIEEGGTLQDAYGVDQSPYAHLDTYDELARTNAGRIFRAMEFE